MTAQPILLRPQQYDPEQERKELNDHLDLVNLAGRSVRLKKSSTKNGAPVWVGLCPFHTEKTPSFHIYEHNNSFYCYGCRASGDAVNFLRRIENLADGKVFERARELAGLTATDRGVIRRKAARLHRELTGIVDNTEAKAAGWQSEEWQAFARGQVAECQARMTGPVLEEFKKSRGLSEATIKQFEVGWTGNKAASPIKVGDRTLFIRPFSYIFPVYNADGTIRMLKWRHTRPADIKKYGKYGQLAGGQAGIFNLAAVQAETDKPAITCTGEFEVMILWQTGITACCHTGGEGASIDFDATFDQERALFYIADNDQPGRQAAARKQAVCPRLKVCYVDEPHKDLTEQALASGLTQSDVWRFLSGARGPQAKRHARPKTYEVELSADDALRVARAQQCEPVELSKAREILAKPTAYDKFYGHKNKAARHLLHVAAQPGVGKGFAFNEEATRTAKAGKGRTLWLAPRNNMFGDQERDPEWWKNIEGRKPAHDSAGNPVDFCDPTAVAGSGTCSVNGAEYHRLMNEKFYQLYSHEYCKSACPLLERCKQDGYYSKHENDGRNAFGTFAHLFTTTPDDYSFIVVDEPRYQDFVNVVEVSDGDLGHLLGYTYNAGMLAIMKAIREIMTRRWVSADGKTIMDKIISNYASNQEIDDEADKTPRLNGKEFILELDKTLRLMAGGRGLLAHLDQAKETGHWMNQQVWELLEEKTPEAAKKLPPNVWQSLASKPKPGAGGLYDILLEEAEHVLAGELEFEFESRLELVKPHPAKSAKLVMYRRNYLPEAVSKKPIVVLDASTPPELIQEMFTTWINVQVKDKENNKFRKEQPIWKRWVPRIETVAPVVELPQTVEIVQKTRRNYAKSTLLKSYHGDLKRRYWNTFVSDVIGQMRKGEQTLLVACKAVAPLLADSLIERGITADKGYHYAIEHYQNLRGSNQYKGYQTVIEAGVYMPQPASTIAAGRALYAGDGTRINPTLTRIQQIYQHRVNGSDKATEVALADDVLMFQDSRLQLLQEQEGLAEHLQIAYRIRPLDATGPKRIVLLFAMPVPGLELNQLITEDGAEGITNARSLRVLDKLITTLKEIKADYESRDAAFLITGPELSKKAQVAIATTYKYFEQAVKEAGLECHAITYPQKMPGRKDKDGNIVKRECLKDLGFATQVGISPKAIIALIMFRETPTEYDIDDRWLIDGTPLDGIPELELPEISSAEEVAPAYQGLVSVKLGHLEQLAREFYSLIEFYGGNYALPCRLKRAEHSAEVAALNKLVRLHRPRRQVKAVA